MLRGSPNVSWSVKKKLKATGLSHFFFSLKSLYFFFQKKGLLETLENSPIIKSYLQADNF